MNTDSIIVYTYDEQGILREKIWAEPHYCYYENYYLNGNTMYKHECRLPDSLSYFKDYYYYPKEMITWNESNKWPQPYFPLHFGTSGDDGVSAPGTFKLYFNASTITGYKKGSCNTMMYYPDGKPKTIISDAWHWPYTGKHYSRNGRESADTSQFFYTNGRLQEMNYVDKIRLAAVHLKWHENGNPLLKTWCKYSPLSEDTSKAADDLKNAVASAYDHYKTEIRFHANGLLESQNTLFIAASYDSAGGLLNETLTNVAHDYWPEWNTTGLLHRGTFKEGMRDGPWQAFYAGDTAKLCYRVNYENGLLAGEAIVCDSTGKTMLRCFIKDGYYDGQLLKLDNGDTAQSGNYKNGLQDGKWYYYYLKGKLARVDSFNYISKKLFHSTLLTYNRDPYYKQSEKAYSSEEEYTEIYYHPNGNKSIEVSQKGHNTLSVKQYDENGTLKQAR